MLVEVTAVDGGKQSLVLRGVHGARAGKFEQSVDLTPAQRVQLATALLEGTDHGAVRK